MPATIIPKDKLPAYARWELNSFDAPGRRGVALTTAEQVEKIHQQAWQEGRQAGFEEGRKRGVAESARMAAIAGAFAKEVGSLDQAIAQQTLDLALEVARQMLRTALAVRPELVLPVIQDALRELPGLNEERQVRLNPEDAPLARQMLQESLSSAGWKIVEDAAVARGGCRVLTSQGEADATVAVRWERIAAAFGREGAWLAAPGPGTAPA
jgi:flagellar assembly protein FliH